MPGMAGEPNTPAGGAGASAGGATSDAGAGGMDVGGEGGAGGDGGVVPAMSCKGTPPECNTQTNVSCSTIAGCSLNVAACKGEPTPCAQLLGQGQCNSTQGCKLDNGACVVDTSEQRIACSTYASFQSCADAGCDYVPCGGTPTACATFDETTCALHSGCSWN
jgi:hypothetical protein